jgi:phospholipid/cholesterol/gamma-HCH transport system ATP-binding protein
MRGDPVLRLPAQDAAAALIRKSGTALRHGSRRWPDERESGGSSMTQDRSAPIVELRNVSFAYGDRAVLHDVSFTVPQGGLTALVGPMGAGKTTLLRLVGGLLRPQQGEVLFEGEDVARMDRQRLYAMRRRMGMMFQFGALFADISVFDNVAFPLREHTRLPERLIRDIVLMKLHAVGLRGARDLQPSSLSGGMMRRVALARAIALDPDLVIYDEPFSGLDPISLQTVARLMRQLNDSMGLSSLFVSHEIERTFEIADQVVILADGRMVAQGSPAQLQASSDPMVHQYVNSLPDGPVGFQYPAVPVEQAFDRRPH